MSLVPRSIPLPAETWEYRLHIPRDPRAPGIARDTLRSILTRHGLPQLIDKATLLTSELTTNAFRYAEGPVSVTLDWRRPALRVSVCDTNPELPTPFSATPEEDMLGGRGLLILDLLSDNWGGYAIDKEPFGLGGKLIWFELLAV
jgi:anti-sigma regulatory factor (Ser/Thr protein kinase)